MKDFCLALDSSLQPFSIIPDWDLAGFSACCVAWLFCLYCGNRGSECCPEELILKKYVLLWQDDKVLSCEHLLPRSSAPWAALKLLALALILLAPSMAAFCKLIDLSPS